MDTGIPPKSLVLVLGAGASKEVNLPVGEELRAKIAQVLDIRYEHGIRRIGGDAGVEDAFRSLAAGQTPASRDINPFLRSAWRIRDAMPQAISIDNFIDSNRNDALIAICGKLAIARCILSAESKSSLYVSQRDASRHIKFADVEATWFNSFFQLLTENCQEAELDERLARVAIISFNYDRCIAHYLHGALKSYYGVNDQRAAQAMSCLHIFHPYGSVGKLPWQSPRDGVEYGAETDGQGLIRISAGLRTFT